MKIQTGMKCKQTKVIEEYGLDFIGMEFEIVEANNNVIKCKSDSVYLNIDINQFDNYFKLIDEEVKENIKSNNANNHKDKKVKIINTKGFIRDDYKDLDKYIGQTGIVRWDFEGNGHRLSIKFDDEIIDNINDSNGRLCFRIDSVEFIEDIYVESIEKENKTLDIKDIEIGQKYRVIENRNTYYGSCDDIIKIEGQEVEVYGINENNEGDIALNLKMILNIHVKQKILS